MARKAGGGIEAKAGEGRSEMRRRTKGWGYGYGYGYGGVRGGVLEAAFVWKEALATAKTSMARDAKRSEATLHG